MDKDTGHYAPGSVLYRVSTLVLMDSWIKTIRKATGMDIADSFNPCFNGFMDKDPEVMVAAEDAMFRFNPCFNGFMDKDSVQRL